jgi:hypothetical protein
LVLQAFQGLTSGSLVQAAPQPFHPGASWRVGRRPSVTCSTTKHQYAAQKKREAAGGRPNVYLRRRDSGALSPSDSRTCLQHSIDKGQVTGARSQKTWTSLQRAGVRCLISDVVHSERGSLALTTGCGIPNCGFTGVFNGLFSGAALGAGSPGENIVEELAIRATSSSTRGCLGFRVWQHGQPSAPRLIVHAV